MINRISFKFSGFSGDVIYYMAGIKEVCEQQNAKAEIYLWLDREGKLYDGAYHPYEGKMLNRYSFGMLYPLLMNQSYVASVQPWTGQKIMVDMDKIREAQLDMPYGNLAHWLGLMFPDMQADLSLTWLNVVPLSEYPQFDGVEIHKHIVVNRTARYLNPYVSYYLLNDYRDHLIFAGLEKEYHEFKKQWCIENLKLLVVTDFLELATVINNCKFFIGNQSMCFGIAEALKVPRLLEMCPYAPNIHPVGHKAHYFKFQEGLSYWVPKLDKGI